MGNSRSFRRRLEGSRRTPRPRYPYGGPSLGTVRRWMKQLEADGDIESKGVDRTGKPGRPATLWGFTEAGKRRARERNWTAAQLTDMITRAIHDRQYSQVPYLLRHLAMKDPDEARRITESLAELAGGA